MRRVRKKFVAASLEHGKKANRTVYFTIQQKKVKTYEKIEKSK